MTDTLPLVTLERGSLRAVFAPTQGGRLLSLRAGDEELLWQNPALIDASLVPVKPIDTWPSGDAGMGTWANLGGSKTWPAPQGWSGPDEWAGPPDPVLDSGAWEVMYEDATMVRLRSGSDPRSGLRIEREFTLVEDGLEERIIFTNEGDWTTSWSPWEVCQVRTEDGGSVVVSGAGPEDELDLGTWEGAVTSHQEGNAVVLPVGTGVAKRGYRSGQSIGYRRASGARITLSAVEEPEDDAPYPDGGAMIEVWLQRPVSSPLDELEGLRPDAHLAELEVLGRRSPLEAGASRETVVHWTIHVADALDRF